MINTVENVEKLQKKVKMLRFVLTDTAGVLEK